MRPTPTLDLLLDLAARLRLACEAVGDRGVDPNDVRLEDLSPAERARLRRAAQDDLFALINGDERRPAPPPAIAARARAAGAA